MEPDIGRLYKNDREKYYAVRKTKFIFKLLSFFPNLDCTPMDAEIRYVTKSVGGSHYYVYRIDETHMKTL